MIELKYKDIEYNGITELYTAIVKLTDKSLKLINLDSTYFEILAKSGELITDSMELRIGKNPR